MDVVSSQNSLWAEALIDRYGDMVYRLALVRTGDAFGAEDVFQEVFLRLVKAQPSFASEEHAKAWLIRVTINCTKKLLFSSWRRKTQPILEEPAATQPEFSSVWLAVCSLPQDYRTVIYLHYYEGYKLEEIAQMTTSSLSSVKVRLHRARLKLRTYLEGGFGDE